jgi:hypothetical protein
MDAYQRELNDMRRELQSLGRKELQALAKSYGVKANIKSSEIIEELLRVSTSGEQRCTNTCSLPSYPSLPPSPHGRMQARHLTAMLSVLQTRRPVILSR